MIYLTVLQSEQIHICTIGTLLTSNLIMPLCSFYIFIISLIDTSCDMVSHWITRCKC